MLKRSISLVMPVYNEREIIEDAVIASQERLGALSEDFEIIIVDDGSDDGTGDILRRICAGNDRLRVISNGGNMGSGLSLWRGLKHARKELALSNFADTPFDVAELEKIVPLFDDPLLDFVVVARKDRSANSLFRKLTSYVNFLLIRILFGTPIRDFQFVQVYKTSVLRDIEIRSSGTFVPPELMLRLIRGGCRYKQVISAFRRREKGVSKCGNFREIAKTVREMMVFRFLPFSRHRSVA